MQMKIKKHYDNCCPDCFPKVTAYLLLLLKVEQDKLECIGMDIFSEERPSILGNGECFSTLLTGSGFTLNKASMNIFDQLLDYSKYNKTYKLILESFAFTKWAEKFPKYFNRSVK